MDMKFIIPRAEAHRLHYYSDYAYVTGAIATFIRGQMGREYRLYEEKNHTRWVWPLLYDDIEQLPSPVVQLASVYDLLETHSFGEQENQIRIRPLMNNGVFLYPQFGVVLTQFMLFESHSDRWFEFVFAPDDETLARFMSFVRERMRRQSRDSVEVFTDGEHGLNRSVETITRRVTRDDVILPDVQKNDIYRSIEAFFAEDKTFYKLYEIPHKRGILLYGHPGNGKTTLVKSIISSIDAPVAYWQITQFTSSDSIEEVFREADRMAPMVLVIEDIDSMPEHARSMFLNTLDGATSKEGIFLIGTTNYPDRIDPALMNRAGRFDRAYEMKLPDQTLRERYLIRRGLGGFASEAQVAEAARATDGFSFAQLNELFVSVALRFHTEGIIDIRETIRDLNRDLDQAKSMSWLEDRERTKVGFSV